MTIDSSAAATVNAEDGLIEHVLRAKEALLDQARSDKSSKAYGAAYVVIGGGRRSICPA
jgi:hypothetical protein